MASRGLSCLPSTVNEIDLPVQKRGYARKTRRPYGALDTKAAHVKHPLKEHKQNGPCSYVFGWDDHGEKQNLHMDEATRP